MRLHTAREVYTNTVWERESALKLNADSEKSCFVSFTTKPFHWIAHCSILFSTKLFHSTWYKTFPFYLLLMCSILLISKWSYSGHYLLHSAYYHTETVWIVSQQKCIYIYTSSFQSSNSNLWWYLRQTSVERLGLTSWMWRIVVELVEADH